MQAIPGLQPASGLIRNPASCSLLLQPPIHPGQYLHLPQGIPPLLRKTLLKLYTHPTVHDYYGIPLHLLRALHHCHPQRETPLFVPEGSSACLAIQKENKQTN